MRYYLIRIYYNATAAAEDRPAPSAFNSFNDALKAYHKYLGDSIGASTCGWVLAMIINDHGKTELMERWDAPTTPTPEGE